MNAADFARAVRTAEPGTVIVYLVGSLANDRCDPETNWLAENVQDAAARGDVMLTQRRVLVSYEYLATVCKGRRNNWWREELTSADKCNARYEKKKRAARAVATIQNNRPHRDERARSIT